MRARSEPRPLAEGNPFWSERLQNELQLQAMRPLDLSVTSSPQEVLPPVPDGDWSEGDGSRMDPEMSAPREFDQRGRRRSRGRRAEGQRAAFQTPSSWKSSDGLMPGRNSEGLMPQQSVSEAMGCLKTQGPMPSSAEGGGDGEAPSQETTLEEAIGEELVQRLLRENQELKDHLKRVSSSGGNISDTWSNVTPPEEPKTPRGHEVRGGKVQRFTPGGTQVPMVSPPKSEGEGDVPMPPPLPPMPSGLEFYEKGGQGHVGPCLRDFGKPWIPVSCRPGYQNEWSIFPGEQASEKEKFIRHALDEWDRRHFRPDGSWRQDWSPTASDPPQPPPRPPQVVASNHGVCPDGRAFSRAVLGGPLQGYGVCHDGRASGSTVLGELCQGPGVCHDSRAAFGKVLGDHLGRSGVCQDGRAIPGTVLGVHQPPSCEFPDSRAFGRVANNLTVKAFVIPRWMESEVEKEGMAIAHRKK